MTKKIITSFNPNQKRHYKLDLKDQKILFHLMKNSRMSFAEIAKKVGLSKESVQYRFNRFLERGIIIKTYAEIDFAKFGYQRFHLLLLLDESKKEKQAEFIKSLMENKNVVRVLEFNDNWDLEIVLIAKNLLDFDRIAKSLLDPFNSVILKKDTEAVITAVEHHCFPEIKKININEVPLPSENTASLDEKDLEIISQLSLSARISTYKIAEKVNLSADAIGLRIKKLLKLGVIKNFTCLLNFSALNYEGFVFCFSASSISKNEENKFFYYMLNNNNIIAVKKMLGTWDLKNYVVVKKTEQYHQLIKDLKLKFGKILRTYETWVLYKEHYFNSLPAIILQK